MAKPWPLEVWMKRNERNALIATLVVLDAAMVEIALLAAYWLRIGSGLLPYGTPANFTTYLALSLMSLPIWLILFALTGLYDTLYLLGGPQEYSNVVKACTFGVIGLIVMSFWQRAEPLSRGWLLMAWLLSVVLVTTARFAGRRVVFALHRYGWFITSVIIAGISEQGRAIARQLSQDRSVRVVGFVDDFLPVGTKVVDGLEVLGPPSQLASLAARHGVREVIVLPSAVTWETFQELIEEASQPNGFQVQLSPGFYEILTTGVQVSHKWFVPLLRIEQVRITGIDAALKLGLDYGVGIFLTLLALPLMVLLALAIWLTDGRPILERHPVLGLKGRVFPTLKFRTRLLGGTHCSVTRPLSFAVDNPGHTWWLGRAMYRTGLDKLPQLVNVLRGQMSLVGPRTISVGSEDRYRRWLRNLLTVKPGITGPWAVANISTLEDEMRLNMYYVRNWTIWMDLQTLFQTVKRILLRGRR
jgi:lipopolysaccharide/colanic/teichoic acid biosynthesis glycosyltransferase